MSDIKVLDKDEFRRMQLLQKDMLRELDRVCRANNIQYTIFGGTLLGAVRHKGYIPWDDDADVAMLREDYNRFKEVAYQMDPKICYFQDHTTDPEYRWGYGKLRRTGTRFVRIGQEHLKCKTGVFIDVFPMDDIPVSLPGQILNNAYDLCLRKILYSEVGRLNQDSSMLSRGFYSLLAKIPVDKVFALIRKMELRSKNSSENRVRVLMFPATGALYRKNPIKERFGMPKKWFTDLQEYEFEDLKLYGTKDYDGILTYIYGDYMTLPPLDKRDPHAPVSDYKF